MGLKQLRKRAGLTLAELGRLTGFGKSTIGNFENGKTEASPEFLKTLAEFFKVTEQEIRPEFRIRIVADKISERHPAYHVSDLSSALAQIDALESQLKNLRKTIERMKP